MSKHLLKIVTKFVEIEKQPARVRKKYNFSTNQIRSIFLEFYEFGISDKSKNLKPELILDSVAKHSEFLKIWIGVYATSEIEFDEFSSDISVYKVRSGIEFLVKDFRNFSEKYDKILIDLEKNGCLKDEFDPILRSWIASGFHYVLEPNEIHKNIPSSHWWWHQ